MTYLLVLCLAAQPVEPAPPKSPVADALEFLVRHQAADGSWGSAPASCSCRAARKEAAGSGGDIETTSWVILAFEGWGFTELCSDQLGGNKLADVVRAGLDWIVSKELRDGAFGEADAASSAVATLALLETAGMTLRRKDEAQRAYAHLLTLDPKESAGIIRKGMAIESAKLDELGTGHNERLLALCSELEVREGPLARTGARLLRAFTMTGAKSKPEVGYKDLPPASDPPDLVHFAVIGTCEMDGGERWHEWYARMTKDLTALRKASEGTCERGSWEADEVRDRIRSTALRCLILEHYRCFHCRNPFRGERK